MKIKWKNGVKSLSVFLAVFVVWAVVCRMGVFSAYVLPSPGKVWQAFLSMLHSGELGKSLLVSLSRVITGFLISSALAFLLGVLTSLSPSANPYYHPVLEFLRHIPPMSLIPLLILWCGIGEASKIIIIVLTTFFPVFLNTNAGLEQCDPKLLEVGRMLEMSEAQCFFRIRLPSALPSILVGMRIGLGYSWRAIIGAEMIAAVSGIGYLILDAQAMSRIDKVIVGIFLIGIIGWLTDIVFGLIIKRIAPEEGKRHV